MSRFSDVATGDSPPCPAHIVAFLMLFSLSAFLPMAGSGRAGNNILQTGFPELLILLCVGIIASAAMVVPGISGSLILMILGYYYGVIGTLKLFLDALIHLDISTLVQTAIPLLFFGIGIAAGIFLIAKAVRYLMEKHAAITYSGILGLVAAAPIAMLYHTGALESLAGGESLIELLVGAVIMLAGFIMIYRINQLQSQKED